MQQFFLSLGELTRFAFSSVRLSSQEACSSCNQHQYWVPHGFVYKKISSKKRQLVGRRLFCSYRYGRQGCGRTRQLYIAQVIPYRHYPLSAIIQFILLLFNHLTVTQAYQRAVGKHVEPRQAYRWLNALYQKLGYLRTQLEKKHRDQRTIPHFTSHRLRLLLPTLTELFQPEPLKIQYSWQRPLL